MRFVSLQRTRAWWSAQFIDTNKTINRYAFCIDYQEYQSFHLVKLLLRNYVARHTFATTVTLANKVSLSVVSKMLGHASIKMTEHYAKVVDENIADETDKLM